LHTPFNVFYIRTFPGFTYNKTQQTRKRYNKICIYLNFFQFYNEMKKQPELKILLWRIANMSDEKAFKQFFEIYADRLYQFAFSFLKNKQIAEEAVADVFFKIWLMRTTLPKIDNIKAYLFKATYNTTVNYLDDEKKRKAIGLDDIKVELDIDRICPETELINKELKGKIEQAIESLPPRCKMIYKLAKVERMKYKEIAELLDISVKTIDNQLTIAIKKIGEEIKTYLNEDGSGKQSLILLKLFVPSEDVF
jgi:RNA polymerase sigma-70 factor (family 1)